MAEIKGQDQADAKRKVGIEFAKRVSDESVLAVGTGSTVDAALVAIGERIKSENLRISVVTSSDASSQRCYDLGFNVLSNFYDQEIDLGFDGADAIDLKRHAIKGKGGAMLHEKILAEQTKHFVVLVDGSKVTDNIMSLCAVPVEVIPRTVSYVTKALKQLRAEEVYVRQAKSIHGPVYTQEGNFILDAKFPALTANLENEIKQITGVVENGLFLSQVDEVLVAYPDRIEKF